jgi:hypothetical protein
MAAARRLAAAAAAIAASVTSVGVQAQVADIAWDAAGSAAHEFRVAPGKFAEWCGKLHQGDKVQWRFESEAALNFNVHYHEGKEVRFPARQDGVARAEGSLQAALDQDFCWMWTNKTKEPVVLKASLQRAR